MQRPVVDFDPDTVQWFMHEELVRHQTVTIFSAGEVIYSLIDIVRQRQRRRRQLESQELDDIVVINI